MNEVKLLNIGGIDQNVKDQYARDIIAPSENGLDSTSNLPVASRPYKTGEFLIGQDRLFYEAINDIEIGDTLVANVNIKATTVSDELVSLRSKSADAAIECIAHMEKTGLSSAEYKVGEYLYWDYGTNAGLYKAKILINIGDAFVVDTNIEAAEPITKSLTGIDGLREEFTQVNNDLGVKNLLPCDCIGRTGTDGGVSYVVNSDGTITATGDTLAGNTSYFSDYSRNLDTLLPDGDYILSGAPENGYYMITLVNESNNNWAQVNGATKELVIHQSASNTGGKWKKAYIQIGGNTTLPSGGVVFKPMIRPAYITDDTYEPYARSNQELTGEVEPMLNVLGAKNLLPSNIATQTVSGVTFTVNSDGTIRANGTATSVIQISTSSNFDLKKGAYVLSGCPIGGSNQTYELRLNKVGPPALQIATDWGNGSEIISTDEDITANVNLVIRSGVTVSNLVFKPMIRPASIKDDTYVPYAKTNYELTKTMHELTKTMHKLRSTTITKATDSEGFLQLNELTGKTIINAYYQMWAQPLVVMYRQYSSTQLLPYVKWYTPSTNAGTVALTRLPVSTNVSVTVFYLD